MNNEHIVKVSHMLKSVGIIVNAYNIIGLPHETLELSLQTIKLNAQMHTDNVIINMFTPYPTTKLREIAQEAGFIDPNIGPNDPVKLRMPGYSRSDILYIRYSFVKLMRQYQKIYKTLTGEQMVRAIERLDSKVLGERHPRWLIGAIRNRKHRGVVYVKRVASRYLPSVYKMLRRKRDEKAAKEGASTG
jgi:radical SAM superfamily enzyme YgiQ (UPF0313 family)